MSHPTPDQVEQTGREFAPAPGAGPAAGGGPAAERDVRPPAGPGGDAHRAAPPRPDPADPVPLGIPREPTGDTRVDASLERLGDADHLPADGHIAVYEDVHLGLREALDALDARPAPSAHDHRS